MSLRRKPLLVRKLHDPLFTARILLLTLQPRTCISHDPEKNGGFHNDGIKSQERRLMMDLVFVLAIIGFFGLCIAYTYAFDRI